MSSLTLEQRIDGIVGEFISPDGPGLSLLIGRGDNVLLKKGYGFSDVPNKIPVTPDSRFIIASVTKQFTALCIMMLKQRGLVSYDEPIGRFFPRFPEYRNVVTLRHLITHTSGIKEYLTEQFWEDCISGKPFTQDSLIELIGNLGDLEFCPGQAWKYCNSGYILLGAIVEQVSGQSFRDFLSENVFEPLGMASTVVGTTGDRLPRQAIGYTLEKDAGFSEAPYSTEVVGWADGNIISTVEDLFLWNQALYTDRLLPYEDMAEAFVPYSPLDLSFTRYGFGHIMSERRGVREVHHSGSTLGYVARFTRFTDERLAIIILSNAAGIDTGELTGAIADVMLESRMRPVVPVQLPREHLAEKTGRFVDRLPNSRSSIEVRIHEGSHKLTAVSSARVYRGAATLTPLGRDLFRFDNRSDMYIQFLRDEGRISGLRVQANGRVQNFCREA